MQMLLCFSIFSIIFCVYSVIFCIKIVELRMLASTNIVSGNVYSTIYVDLTAFFGWPVVNGIPTRVHEWLLVKCGIAVCGMRKVKCGMGCAESYCVALT